MFNSLVRLFQGGESTTTSSGIIRSNPNALGYGTNNDIQSNFKQGEFQRLERLENTFSQADVVAETERTEFWNKQQGIQKKIIALRQQQLSSLESIYRDRQKHQQNVLKTAQDVAEIDKDHAEFLLEHGLQMETKKAAVRGMTAAYEGARTLVG